MIPARPAPPRRRVALSWRSPRLRGWVYQLVALVVIVGLVALLTSTTLANMRARGIQSGFDFLAQPAGFDIGEAWFGYESNDAYWKAFAVGAMNTLRVAIVGIVLCTILGVTLGLGRFSRNALVRGICYGYVELFRNVPVLLQLLVWYLALTEFLPPPMEPVVIGHLFFLSKNGLSFPSPVWLPGHGLTVAIIIAGVVAAIAYVFAARRHFERTGQPWPVALGAAGIVVAGLGLALLAGGAPLDWELPALSEIQVEGGASWTPEFLAVLLGLVFYTSAFVAEVVRAGIASVPAGQIEASAALGLPRMRAMQLVVLPQALRLIVPPLTNQYLNLTKNSSLAVAVGYPDVVSIANTAINQSGRAVECIAIIMAVYLTTSLLTSAAMAWVNRRAALKER
ncbi:ABC transporter permease subunit [Ramlibacter sp. XY19]|uniref:amino acid ABC transporter permease n=1 Tax=Ramlibacter paludis TaxID=2908000 RepID=UPI0023DB5473|nr:ABC transporter permease subunit [Ramlibacter paludis]MCG2592642.1 ABC transporter permease subunit [Ramlibacter paludis]